MNIYSSIQELKHRLKTLPAAITDEDKARWMKSLDLMRNVNQDEIERLDEIKRKEDLRIR